MLSSHFFFLNFTYIHLKERRKLDERERVRFSLAGLPRIIKLLRRLFKMYVEYIPLKKFVLVRRELAVTETVATVFLSNIKVHINSWHGVSQVTASKLKTGISKEKKVRQFEDTDQRFTLDKCPFFIDPTLQ